MATSFRQARWPAQILLEGKLDLVKVISPDNEQALRRLKAESLTFPEADALQRPEDDSLIPGSVVRAVTKTLKVQPDQARRLSEQIVLRVYEFLSSTGTVPEEDDVKWAEGEILSRELDNLFPATEPLENVWSSRAVLTSEA